jgi:hypothetical protein
MTLEELKNIGQAPEWYSDESLQTVKKRREAELDQVNILTKTQTLTPRQLLPTVRGRTVQPIQR